jgi:hypothetical protein
MWSKFIISSLASLGVSLWINACHYLVFLFLNRCMYPLSTRFYASIMTFNACRTGFETLSCMLSFFSTFM